MIDKGILPKGTALTPINPLPADVAVQRLGAAVEFPQPRREAVVRPDGRGVRGVLRIHRRLLRVVLDDDDGVIGFGDDPDVRTAPLGVVGGAVVGVLTGLSPR